jgi:hypothetical protein
MQPPDLLLEIVSSPSSLISVLKPMVHAPDITAQLENEGTTGDVKANRAD